MNLDQQPRSPDSSDDSLASSLGLNPVDILALPTSQRRLVTWMMRQGAVSLEAIATFLQQSEEEVAVLVQGLMDHQFISITEVDGQTLYRLRLIRRRPPRSASLWQSLDEKD